MAADDKKVGTMKYDDWIKHWSDDDAPFHVDEPDEVLVGKASKYFSDKPCRVFVPLCGKTVDILWLYNHGHTVVGVEIAERAVADFFKEQKLESQTETVANVGNVYRTKDKRIQLYAADVFKITPDLVGTFDVIWDSAGLSVINKDDRPKYFKLMKSLTKPESTYFVAGSDYDSSVWPGPPHPLNKKVLEQICGDLFNVETLQEMDMRAMGCHVQVEAELSQSKEQAIHDKTKDDDGNSFATIEKALLKSDYLFYKYHRLTLKETK